MCSPLIIGVASAAIGTYGSIQQGKAQSNAANYQAQVQDNNAKIAEFKARDAIVRGNEEQKKQHRYTAQVLAKQRAAHASSGVDVTYGSVLDEAVDTAMLGELDALTIQSNSYREAYDHKLSATNARTGAGLSRMQGRNTKKAGDLKAAATLLGGAGDAYKSYKKTSAFV